MRKRTMGEPLPFLVQLASQRRAPGQERAWAGKGKGKAATHLTDLTDLTDPHLPTAPSQLLSPSSFIVAIAVITIITTIITTITIAITTASACHACHPACRPPSFGPPTVCHAVPPRMAR
jgi:hypothetical protein